MLNNDQSIELSKLQNVYGYTIIVYYTLRKYFCSILPSPAKRLNNSENDSLAKEDLWLDKGNLKFFLWGEGQIGEQENL